jgi:hypothetical protein
VKPLLIALSMLLPASAHAQAADPVASGGPPGTTPAFAPQAPPPPVVRERHGVTLEVNLGLGLVWARSGDNTSDTETALAGLDAGLGGWLNPSAALSFRVAGTTFHPSDGVQFTSGFVGPSLQYWTSDHVWLGGGVGLAFVSVRHDGGGDQPDSDTGLGLDLRLGYTFSTASDHTFNLSVELNPGFFHVDTGLGSGEDINLNSFGILLGYQHL